MTPTREQLIEEVVEEVGSALWCDLCEGDGQHSEALDKSLIRKHLRKLAAAIATQEAAPMPPIEVGDWVNLATEYRTDVMRIRSGYGRVSSDIEADAFNQRGRWHVALADQQPPDITEIRKANGTVWRRP